MRTLLEIFFSLLFLRVNASKCPESRKPHVTSCVIFYNCINLPEGGYVWAPSRCANGLVFQPSLRICVLPGDTWNCSDEQNYALNTDMISPVSDLIDKTTTSYGNLNTDDVVYSFNISHKIDSISNLGNIMKTLPYPLIEIDDELTKYKKHEINPDASQMTIKRQENDLSNVNHRQEYIPITLINAQDEHNNKIQNLKPFIDRVLLYQHFAPSLKQQTIVTLPVTNNQRINNDLLNFFIENYVFNKKSENSTLIKNNDIVTSIPVQSNFISTTEKNQINIETIDELNNILAISGNLGRKEYVTIEKYNSWSNKHNIAILEVIPCVQARRLPNMTDCTKYYTCDPTSAEIHEFICPPNTAFNNQISLCDTKKYKLCRGNGKIMQADTRQPVKLCETTGKFEDTTSNQFYYLCYSSNSSGKIESFRMVCPNNLIFCQARKVCTAKQFCNNDK